MLAIVEGEIEKPCAGVEDGKDLDVLKSRLDGALSPGLVEGVPARGKGVEQEDPLRIPSNPNHSRILQASAPAWAHCEGSLAPLPQAEGKQAG